MRCLRHMVLLVAAFLFPLDEVRADLRVVLVTGNDCPVKEVTSLDVRKAYLGIRVSIDGHGLIPIRLVGDELLTSVFYQSIVSMSRKSYERRELSLTLKYGTPRAETVESVADAVALVRKYKCGIAYLWKQDADRFDVIRPVKTLWQSE